MYVRPSARTRHTAPPSALERPLHRADQAGVAELHLVRAALAHKRRLELDRDASRQVSDYLHRGLDDEPDSVTTHRAHRV